MKKDQLIDAIIKKENGVLVPQKNVYLHRGIITINETKKIDIRYIKSEDVTYDDLLVFCELHGISKTRIRHYHKNIGQIISYIRSHLNLYDERTRCRNLTTFISMENLTEVSLDKFIKLSNGYGYDIDELVEYMVSTKCKNINPSDPTKNSKIWNSEYELTSIINNSHLDPEILKRYKEVQIDLQKEKENLINIVENNVEILELIAETGFKLLNDNISSFSDNPDDFKISQTQLLTLKDKLNSNKEKDQLLNLYVEDKTIGEVLDSAHTACIHGIGVSLMSFYATWWRRLQQKNKDISLSKYFMKIDYNEGKENKSIILSAGIVSRNNIVYKLSCKVFYHNLYANGSFDISNIYDVVNYSCNHYIINAVNKYALFMFLYYSNAPSDKINDDLYVDKLFKNEVYEDRDVQILEVWTRDNPEFPTDVKKIEYKIANINPCVNRVNIVTSEARTSGESGSKTRSGGKIKLNIFGKKRLQRKDNEIQSPLKK